jgi:PAS domain S-box-containing protein
MDRVNRAIQGTRDLEQMMCDVLDVVLDVLECDRAWLLYPCDVDAPTWRIPMERTRPEYPGVLALGLDLPMTPELIAVHRSLLASPGPVRFGPGAEQALQREIKDQFGFQSQLAMAIYPKGDKPYAFGINQCSRARDWTSDDGQLLQEIGRRLADALTSLHVVRRLRESEARYRGLMDNATDGFFLMDDQGTVHDVNRQACESLGMSREELLGKTPFAFDPDITLAQITELKEAVNSGRTFVLDTRHRRKDGSTFPVELRVRKMDSEGEWRAVSLARDMTERKKAEESLGNSERRLRAFFETSNAGIIEIDATGHLVRANEAFCAMTGFTASELDRKEVREIIFPEDMELFLARWRELASGRADRSHTELRYRRKDGTSLWTLGNVVVLSRDDSGAPVACSAVVIDLTERKRLEDHLQRAQKMEAIGQLAGGVAHDFNNLLTVINGYSEILLASHSGQDGTNDAVTAIRDAGERAARLTRQLLAFSRKAIVEPKVLDLNELIGATTRMLSRLVGEDVTLVTELGEGLAAVRADAGQIEQVILNLAVNARDAMPKGGRLTISTDEIDIGAGEDWDGEALGPGRHVRLRVADTGSGMTEEVRARLFEPFFTTKGIGRGTGLGLATVYGIVRQANGHVSVDSTLGAGTVFTVLLPAVTASVVVAATEVRASARGTETILLVEDEDAVRALTRRILERQGYTLLEAADGREALRIADAHAGPIDLLLTDVVMPNLGGRDLAEAVRARRPETRVLYMSGFTDDAVVRHGVSVAADALLQKPFTPIALTRKVRSILDGSSSPESA